MNKAKYVIVNGSAIVFSAAITHSDMVGFNQKADGAGFVTFFTKTDSYGDKIVVAECYGESISLGVTSREEQDSIIVTQQICRNF